MSQNGCGCWLRLRQARLRKPPPSRIPLGSRSQFLAASRFPWPLQHSARATNVATPVFIWQLYIRPARYRCTGAPNLGRSAKNASKMRQNTPHRHPANRHIPLHSLHCAYLSLLRTGISTILGDELNLWHVPLFKRLQELVVACSQGRVPTTMSSTAPVEASRASGSERTYTTCKTTTSTTLSMHCNWGNRSGPRKHLDHGDQLCATTEMSMTLSMKCKSTLPRYCACGISTVCWTPPSLMASKICSFPSSSKFPPLRRHHRRHSGRQHVQEQHPDLYGLQHSLHVDELNLRPSTHRPGRKP